MNIALMFLGFTIIVSSVVAITQLYNAHHHVVFRSLLASFLILATSSGFILALTGQIDYSVELYSLVQGMSTILFVCATSVYLHWKNRPGVKRWRRSDD